MKAKLRVRIILIAVACIAVLAAAWAGGSYAIRAKNEKDCPLCGAPQVTADNCLGIYDITNHALQVLVLAPVNHQGESEAGNYTSMFSGAFSGSVEHGAAKGFVRKTRRADAESLARLCDACRQKLLAVADHDVVLVDLCNQKAYPVCGNLDYFIEQYHITAQQKPDGKTLLCVTEQTQGDGTPA